MRSSYESYLHHLILHSQSLSQTKQLHARSLLLQLLPNSSLLSSALILSYSSFQTPSSSLLLLDSSPNSSAFLHNSLIRALSNSNLPFHSLLAYNSMLRRRVPPDHRTFPYALKACADSKSSRKGRELHASAHKLGFVSDLFVGNTLVAFYGACAELASARWMFDEMPHRDVVTWNSIITVSSDNGSSVESMDWFRKLVRSGLVVNSVSLVSVMPVCGETGSEEFGMGVHGYAVKVGLDCNVTVANAIVDMYGRCGDSEASVRAFRGMEKRNDVSWNSVIGKLAHVGKFGEAVRVFTDMLASDEAKPNTITISSLLPALAELGWFSLGKEVHGYCVRTGLDSDVYVGNSLVDMYAKSGCVNKASDVFYRMESRNVVSWNAMIANLAQNGAHLEAIGLVVDMQESGEFPNSVTFTNVLPACARIASLKKGKEIHALSIRNGSCLDLFVSNALIDVYAKCGRLDCARRVFEVSERDQVSYNALIVGYSQSTFCSEAVPLFLEMGFVGLQRDVVSFKGVLSACANLSALKQGKEIHCLSVRKLLDTHIIVANSLLDFYTKCGRLDIAKKIFDRMPNKDVASWNAMILGYGMQGELETAIDLFDLMEGEGIGYDHVSYIAVLSACSHGGLVDRGMVYFEKMLDQNVRPTQMHYACMVDLLSRAGRLTKAYKFITSMPIKPDSSIWGSLLCGCRIHRDVKLAERVAEHVFELEPENTGYYVLLANLYAEVEKWEAMNKIREKIGGRGLLKNPGCSWIEIKGRVHVFAVGNKSHPQSEKIELFLEDIRKRMKEEGYVPRKKFALMDDNDTMNEDILCGHSEQQAIAFGILNLPKGKPIRVAKNLGICGDCHMVAKFISKMASREIMLRDSNRFHRFEEGRCSCRSYW
nr:pentatricopeptide repeat protein AaPPR221 [Agave angustifolia]UPT49755.1 pentatricopeptide repeat protein AaPPR1362 [Agave angustifolia]